LKNPNSIVGGRHAEGAAVERLATFEAFFRNAPVAMLLLDEDRRVCEMNRATEATFATSANELKGFPFGDAVHCVHSLDDPGGCGLGPDCEKCSVRRVLADTFETGQERRQVQARLVLGDERDIHDKHVLISIAPIELSTGRQVLVCIEDISTHVRTTEGREESNARFQLACETANIAICTTDLVGRFTMVNKQMCITFGYTEEEFLGMSVEDITHPEDLEVTLRFIRQAASGKVGHGRFVKRYVHKDGRTIWGELSSSTLQDAQGTPQYFVTFIHDITERKLAEEALKTSHDSLAEAQRIAHVGNWDWDIESNELNWSDEVYRIFGLSRQEFGATYEAFLDYVHADDRESVKQAVEEAFRESTPYSIYHRIVRPDGSERIVHERAVVTFTKTGQPTRIAGTVQDVTEQKQAEQELREAFQKIDQLRERLQEENVYLREETGSNRGYKDIVGQSEVLRLALGKIEHVAGTNANVLLLGETGTGKELFARAVHNQSPRKQRPLVKVNCAALPGSLIESELFGHIKGAFTGALDDKVGRFQLADGGTLFLDEIGELAPELQTKLLRVLQEGEFERVGGGETLEVDVRIIAATNRDVQEAMDAGRLRPDLYYRLAVFPVEIPPLRLRREDIPLLVWHFIEKKQRGLGKNISQIPKKVMNALTQYDWPGNVRELENVVERAMILSLGPTLTLAGAFAKPAQNRRADGSSCNLEDVERAHIVGVLEDCDWTIKGPGNTADRLGLKPSTLHSRMKKLGIQRPPRRPR